MSAPFKVPAVFEAIDRYTAPLRKMAKSTSSFVRQVEGNVARVNRGFRSMLSPLKKVNSLLGGFGVAAGGFLVVGAITDGINTFKEFEQANANLSSVMATATAPQLRSLQEDSKRLGSITARTSTEVVGLQESFARLGFETPQIIAMTEATISGSIAMNSALDDTANLVGAVVRTFDNLDSVDSTTIIDQMTASTQKSALSFEKLSTSLPIVAGAANAAGVNFDQLLALLGKLSDSGIDASSSANALKNIFIESASQGLSYENILDKIVKDQDNLTAATDEFGKRAAVSGVILAKNIGLTKELEQGIKASGGAAKAAADKQLNTLNGALTLLGSAYEGFILKNEDGKGGLSSFLKTVVQTATEILTLASGLGTAEEKLTEGQKKIRFYAESIIFIGKSIFYAIAALKIIQASIFAYNIILGVTTALQGKAAFSLRANAIALKAYAFITKIVTAAQWLWNAAMSANPIGLIIIGIIALIAVVALIINKWDEWGAALAIFLGPLGLVISLVQTFRKNWEWIKSAFDSSFLDGIKAIGITIFESLIYPVQQLLEILANFTGSEMLNNASLSLGRFTSDLKAEVETVNTKATTASGVTEITRETTNNATVDLNVNDRNNNIDIGETSGNVSLNLTPTF